LRAGDRAGKQNSDSDIYNAARFHTSKLHYTSDYVNGVCKRRTLESRKG